MYKLLKNNYKGGPGSGPRAGNKRGPYKTKKNKDKNVVSPSVTSTITPEKVQKLLGSVNLNQDLKLRTEFIQNIKNLSQNELVDFISIAEEKIGNRSMFSPESYKMKIAISHLDEKGSREIFDKNLNIDRGTASDYMTMKNLCEFAETPSLKKEFTDRLNQVFKERGIDAYHNPALEVDTRRGGTKEQNLIADWVSSSSEDSALWAQAAINEEFYNVKEHYDTGRPGVGGIKYRGVGEGVKRTVANIYKKTQDTIAKKGISGVTIFRGTGTKTVYTSNILESWSSSSSTAKKFTGNILVQGNINTKLIFAYPDSFRKLSGESEYIMIRGS